ncbi:MAG: isoprenylcysteine carboxylmethyltransferase family protein [Calothrix sp. MO_167.B42]|nr:isoprenylcysteine carboxylmethyltransferase family protein [Calothrix sp. MO_167.B42]
MFRKFFLGLVVSFFLFIAPALVLQPEALRFTKLWFMLGIGLLASITQPAYDPIERNAPSEDKGTATQLVWTVYIVLLLGIAESLLWRYPQSMAWGRFSIMTLGLSIAGALLRAWAVAELGKFFTWHVRVQPEQKVIRTGPYEIVRHPSYTGAWVLYVCCLLFIHAWVASALCAIFLLAGFLRRIRYEEELMVDSFGEQYKSYCQDVRQFIPLVW